MAQASGLTSPVCVRITDARQRPYTDPFAIARVGVAAEPGDSAAM